MKIFIKISLSLFLLFALIHHLSCSEDSPIETTGEIEFISYQIPGCNSSSSLEKALLDDYCFTYSFKDTLKIDFCVVGNCCPDSNRFVTNYAINSDTLFVTVKDTAEHLCNCICRYVIHLELFGLPEDQYLFYCNYDSLIEYGEYIIKP